jgi:hypothetical protein
MNLGLACDHFVIGHSNRTDWYLPDETSPADGLFPVNRPAAQPGASGLHPNGALVIWRRH